MSLLQQTLEVYNNMRSINSNNQPIFRLDCSNDAIFYAPDYLVLVGRSDADRFEKMLSSPEYDARYPLLTKLRDKLIHKAEEAVTARHRWQTSPFRPECLTLYLSNQCNLRCVYCYADANPHATLRLELNAIHSAARLVAQSCRQKNCPFTIVFHGGGEPTLDKNFVDQVLATLDQVAEEYEVPTFRYVATNGVMSQSKARWLAHNFDLVGLSCDGPSDIQDHQRPGQNERKTSQLVEQTAHILHEQGCRFQVRVTITKTSLHRQVEIVDYISQQLSPATIHLEPLYHGGRAEEATNFAPADAADFALHFLQARAKAAQYNVPLLYAGSRLNSNHGPYCQIFRNVLNLLPGDAATACFKMTTAAQAGQSDVIIGNFNQGLAPFIINHQLISELRQSLTPAFSDCRNCFNQFHCAGECPDRCLLTKARLPANVCRPGFRCQVQKTLAMATLLETAERLRSTISDDALTNERKVEYGYAGGTSIV